MNAKELYALTEYTVTRNPFSLYGYGYNHLSPELYDLMHKLLLSHPNFEGLPELPESIEVRILKHFNFDHRRFWRLATVWFEGTPVMVIQNAGREGDDHKACYVTDRAAYARMCTAVEKHFIALLSHQCEHPDAPDDLDLTTFYGNGLNGYFARY